jgi:hypothetical protein
LLPPRSAAAASRGPADALQARRRPRKARRRRRPRPHACIRRPRSRRAGPRPAGPRPRPDRRGGESPTPLACRICDQDIPDNIARKNRVTAIRQTRGRKHSSWAHCLYMDVATHCLYIHARASEHAATQRRHRQCQLHRAWNFTCRCPIPWAASQDSVPLSRFHDFSVAAFSESCAMTAGGAVISRAGAHVPRAAAAHREAHGPLSLPPNPPLSLSLSLSIRPLERDLQCLSL